MGLEAKANVVRRNGKQIDRANHATVLWEGDSFVVRGEARIKIVREDITDVTVRGNDLILTHVAGSVVVTLGAELARKWLTKIESKPKSRLEKIGITANTRVALIGWTDTAILTTLTDELNAVGAVVKTGPSNKDDEVILLLVESAGDLARIGIAEKHLGDTASLWVVHQKGVADIADVHIFDAAKRAGLTYTKVASFSATHTAEKLVRPKSARS